VVQLAIRCHRRDADVEAWLEREVERVRSESPDGAVVLSRLTRDGATTGWLVELELDEEAPLLHGQRLADWLTDMRLLGLGPTLLAPREMGISTGRDAHSHP